MPWLLKTEPECYSIDDLARDRATRWTGVRNYQARNFMRDSMRVGDPVLFYHSSAEPPGIAGIARISAAAAPDLTALDRTDDHFDPKSTRTEPIWWAVEVAYVSTFPALIDLATLRSTPGLERMPLLQRGQRLSVQPVSEAEFSIIERLGRGGASPRRSTSTARSRR